MPIIDPVYEEISTSEKKLPKNGECNMSMILLQTQDICAYGTHRLGEISDLICYRTLNFILEVILNYAAQNHNF